MKTVKTYLFMYATCLISVIFSGCSGEILKSRIGVSYMLTISPDLLKFVYPEVTYVDSFGEIHTISGVRELDSLVNVNYTHGGVWTIQPIEGTNYKTWTINMYFDKSPFYSYFGVKYKKLDLDEDKTDKVFDFHHSIFSTAVYTSLSKEFLVENNIVFTNKSLYAGQEAENYINDLINTPDKAGYYINEEGKFTKNDDFDF